jgi:hypothetical protein
MGEWPTCKGCGTSLTAFKPHFRSLPPVGETAVGPAWCEDCIVSDKSDLDKSLVDYVKNLRQNV